VDHFDIQLAGALAAAALAEVVRGGAREQGEGAPTVDESSLAGAFHRVAAHNCTTLIHNATDFAMWIQHPEWANLESKKIGKISATKHKEPAINRTCLRRKPRVRRVPFLPQINTDGHGSKSALRSPFIRVGTRGGTAQMKHVGSSRAEFQVSLRS
jgi:hypothetical protein